MSTKEMRTLTIGDNTYKVTDSEAVCYCEQILTEEQRIQARENIGIKKISLTDFYLPGGEVSYNDIFLQLFMQSISNGGTWEEMYITDETQSLKTIMDNYDIIYLQGKINDGSEDALTTWPVTLIKDPTGRTMQFDISHVFYLGGAVYSLQSVNPYNRDGTSMTLTVQVKVLQ